MPSSNIPTEIAPGEMIVRAICSPYHVDTKKKKLKKGAFEPPADTDRVSVFRGAYLTADRCKEIAKTTIQAPPHKLYQGLATLTTAAIAKADVGLVSSPAEFEGHADLLFGPDGVRVRGEPIEDKEKVKRHYDRIQSLLASALYFQDAAPDAELWQGDALSMAATG